MTRYKERWRLSRRDLVALGAAAALSGVAARAMGATRSATRVKPLPLDAVRLLPSPYLDAVEANRGYLLRIEPDRLLHNFRRFSGLVPKAPAYGGWEADTIAGHTLGHYLSALSLMHAQTGDAECKSRAACIVDQLVECQARSQEGYVAGFTRRRGDVIEDGRVLFDELVKGDIRSAPFNLNGCWVPLYNWHKLFAGLMDAQQHCGNTKALSVAVNLGRFIDGVFAKLSDDQVQKVLDTEHGGINESFAELHARTGERRWLALSERLYHKRVLDPLAAARDELAYLHSNTQIPKLIGLARLHELTGNSRHEAAAKFFWDTVTSQHSYVIGGNGDREYFQEPGSLSKYVTEQTCEACCTYNMLKLTRHLYQWQPQARYFDYYERAHLNHILAHQHPGTGMFTYMTPLMSGAARDFSTPFDDFWCCVGSGMESHARHGDSIYWSDGRTLYVNLYIPSRVDWREERMTFQLESDLPFLGESTLTIEETAGPKRLAVALRLPSWAGTAKVTVNDEAVTPRLRDGYMVIDRRWAKGDVVHLVMPMALRLEPTPGDASTVAVLRGPLVMAADLGPATRSYDDVAPAFVGEDVLDRFRIETPPSRFTYSDSAHPAPLLFRPFFNQYDQRTAVYFRVFDDEGWQAELRARAAEDLRRRQLDARSADFVLLGQRQAEEGHALASKFSYAVEYRGRSGRDARTGGFFEFDLRTRPGPLALQATYWGDERRRVFHLLVEGQRIATETLDGQRPPGFIEVEYAIPEALTRGKEKIRVRFEPEPDRTAGPAFGVRLLAE